jgi:hypothetical protein
MAIKVLYNNNKATGVSWWSINPIMKWGRVVEHKNSFTWSAQEGLFIGGQAPGRRYQKEATHGEIVSLIKVIFNSNEFGPTWDDEPFSYSGSIGE